MTTPGIGWVLGYTIAAEIGDITRFPSPTKLAGYTGLCPQVDLARRLAEAIWHMLTTNKPFAPAGAAQPLAS
jgi:hypothetical protein